MECVIAARNACVLFVNDTHSVKTRERRLACATNEEGQRDARSGVRAAVSWDIVRRGLWSTRARCRPRQENACCSFVMLVNAGFCGPVKWPLVLVSPIPGGGVHKSEGGVLR